MTLAREGCGPVFFKKPDNRAEMLLECLSSDRLPHEELLNIVYLALLGRPIDEGGLESYKRQIETERSGYCLQRIIRDISESDEARRRR